LQGPNYQETVGGPEKRAVKDSSCPACGYGVDVKRARIHWCRFGNPKPLKCQNCGVKYLPEDVNTLSEELLVIGIFLISGLLALIAERAGLEAPLVLAAFAVPFTCMAFLIIIISRVRFENRKVVLKLLPVEDESVPDDLSPEITRNKDGSFTAKEKTFENWKSAEAYLDLLNRRQKWNL